MYKVKYHILPDHLTQDFPSAYIKTLLDYAGLTQRQFIEY